MADWHENEIHRNGDEFFPQHGTLRSSGITVKPQKLVSAVVTMAGAAVLAATMFLNMSPVSITPTSAVFKADIDNRDEDRQLIWILNEYDETEDYSDYIPDISERIPENTGEMDDDTVELTGLTPGGKYCLTVISRDSEGGEEVEDYYIFSTPKDKNDPPPVNSPPPQVNTPSPRLTGALTRTPVPTPTPSPSPTPTPIPTPTPTPVPTPEVIPVPEWTPVPSPTPSPTPTPTPTPTSAPAPEAEDPVASEVIAPTNNSGAYFTVDFGYLLNGAVADSVDVSYRVIGADGTERTAGSETLTADSIRVSDDSAHAIYSIPGDAYEGECVVADAVLNYTDADGGKGTVSSPPFECGPAYIDPFATVTTDIVGYADGILTLNITLDGIVVPGSYPGSSFNINSVYTDITTVNGLNIGSGYAYPEISSSGGRETFTVEIDLRNYGLGGEFHVETSVSGQWVIDGNRLSYSSSDRFISDETFVAGQVYDVFAPTTTLVVNGMTLTVEGISENPYYYYRYYGPSLRSIRRGTELYMKAVLTGTPEADMTIGHLIFNRDDLRIIFDTSVDGATEPPHTLTAGTPVTLEYYYAFTVPRSPLEDMVITGVTTE